MRISNRFRRLASTAVIAAASLLTLGRAAEACSHAPPAPPTMCIQQLDPTHYCILIKNYSTGGGALPGQFCTCALKKLGTIVSIDSFQMRICGTPELVAGWSFTPNPNSSAAWQTILSGPTTGFLSAVGVPIGGQRCIDLYFVVTVAGGTTGPQLAASLSAGGSIVGNGEANSNGVPLAGSFEFRPSGPITILPPVVTTGACCAGSTCSVSSSTACTGANTAFVGGSTGCNAAGNNTSPCCKSDFNHSGSVTVQDIFDFLAAYFGSSPLADFNRSGGIPTVQDIFDFLAAYFAGCP